MAMECVFCGAVPNQKTREHIIPQWLLRMTGEPKRLANFGFDSKSNKARKFPFDAFTFSACDQCNSEYSTLEDECSIVFDKVINGGLVNGKQITTLLDWFDKVRVGIWLGMRQLDRNKAGIIPNFYIKNRIGMHDRVLFIERMKSHPMGVNLIGSDTMSFSLTPNAFCLRVNNFYFYNISHMFLLANGLGFPYPESVELAGGKLSKVTLTTGDGAIKERLTPFDVNVNGVGIFQPMLKGEARRIDLISNGYVGKYMIDMNSGVGKIFVDNGVRNEIDVSDSLVITPDYIDGFEGQMKKANLNVLDIQDFYMNEALSGMTFSLLSKKQKKAAKISFRAASLLNKKYRNLLS